MHDPSTVRDDRGTRPDPASEDAERTQPMPVPPPDDLDVTEPIAAASPRPRRPVVMDAAAWSGVVSTLLMVLAATFEEDGDNGWGRFGLWAAFSVVAAALTLAPVFRTHLRLGREQAWKAAVAGAGGLVLYWVMFVAPWIERNVSFLATAGVAAAIYAAWRAPGRPGEPGAQPF